MPNMPNIRLNEDENSRNSNHIHKHSTIKGPKYSTLLK